MSIHHQPILLGFENAHGINALLKDIGVVPNLGALLSEHLLTVLRRQFSDLEINYIKFIEAENCTGDGIPASNPEIINIKKLSMPINVNIIVTANKERYRLGLHVILNANLAAGKCEIMSDVIVRVQSFLGRSERDSDR